ncbi:MAG: hypothetical protein AAF821_21210 [Cyanobacteria bacterium P01_D01_bin.156]
MEALIENIVDKLKRLSVTKLQMILDFANFLYWQESQQDSSEETTTRMSDWQAFVDEYAGTWTDFPMAEELRQNMGQDVVREEF